MDKPFRVIGLEEIWEYDNRSELLQRFESDSLFFKYILRKIFLLKMCLFFNKRISKSRKLSKLFLPRSQRQILFYELEMAVRADFPKLNHLAIWRGVIFISLVLGPLVLFFTFLDYQSGLLIYVIGVITMSVVVGFLLCMVILMISASFFERLDFERLITVDDLLYYLCITNAEDYSRNDFELTFTSIQDLFQRNGRLESLLHEGNKSLAV
jgi:hypothetical protein